MDAKCKRCGTPFSVLEGDTAFLERVAPVFEGQSVSIPPPTLCPSCRLQRRLAFRNQIHVYTRASSFSGERIFSGYKEEAPFPVVSTDEWWSDTWDPLQFGVEFDFTQQFFPQFEKLRNCVPHLPLSVLNVENCDFCNNGANNKNCYLVFNTSFAEECMYSENVWHSRDCIDCTHTKDSELCYDCAACIGCYNLQSSLDCDNCSDGYFLLTCRDCKSCYGCVNLRHREYCVFNEQKTQAEYRALIDSLSLCLNSKRAELKQQALSFWHSQPRPHVSTYMAENTTGNYIYSSKNVHLSFIVRETEDVRYCFLLDGGAKDCMDYTIPGINAELMYESLVAGRNTHNLSFCFWCANGCWNLLYCWLCFSCKDCFGCVGLRNRQYCVFNRQFEREEYEKLVPRIINRMIETEEWGEFFPASLSAVPYNHSLAYRYFPLTRKEAVSERLRWHDEVGEFDEREAVDPDALPDGLPETDDPIVTRSVESGHVFRITKREIERFRKLNVPLPRQIYNERMNERALRMGGVTLYERACAATDKELLTPHPPDSPWIIWNKEEHVRVYE